MVAIQSGLNNQNQWILLIPGLATFIVFIALLKNRIIIDDQGITRQNLFGEKYISWQGIQQVYTTYERRGKSRSLFFNFIKEGNRYRFAVAMYGRNSIQNIAGAIILKCSDAVMDPQINEMAEGRFPRYIF